MQFKLRKLCALLVLLTLCVACKTKYIESVHYEPVTVTDTVWQKQVLRDSVTLHDSVYIHAKNDTVWVEKWHTQYKWKTRIDTVYKSREVPVVMTDTVATIKEVPVEKEVYKQHWWQKVLSWAGGIGIVLSGIIAVIKLKF